MTPRIPPIRNALLRQELPWLVSEVVLLLILFNANPRSFGSGWWCWWWCCCTGSSAGGRRGQAPEAQITRVRQRRSVISRV